MGKSFRTYEFWGGPLDGEVREISGDFKEYKIPKPPPIIVQENVCLDSYRLEYYLYVIKNKYPVLYYDGVYK